MDLTTHLKLLRALTKQINNNFNNDISAEFVETLVKIDNLITDQEDEDMEGLIDSLYDNLTKEQEEKQTMVVEQETFDGKQRIVNHVFTNSSMLDHVTYDRVTEDLTVWFKNNSSVSYIYRGVTEQEFEGLTAATSAGSWFTSEIKPFHTATKVYDEEE